MGWNKHKKRGRGGGGGDKKKGNDASSKPAGGAGGEWRYSHMDESGMQCDPLDAYYALQDKVTNAEEWAEILKSFRTALPVTFRVNDTNEQETLEIVAKVREIQEKCNPTMPEGAKLTEVPWFPGDGICWEAKVSKRDLSKGADGMKALHEFLVTETDRGNINRQEVVSMIPPLFLDVQPHHLVLDCCAAPGSKTSQIMSALSRQSSPANPVTGCVIANDLDSKRCDVLVKQTHRLRDLYPNTIITNHNAALYPFPHVLEAGEGGAPHLKRVQFDRILADVVCSGDGTFRKSLDLWGRWTPALGNAVHRAQCQILLRCMDLVKVGGRIVYSTCSMNPVEDEAVLNHCMKTSKHGFKLVDCSGLLPTLQRTAGVNEWTVCSKDMQKSYKKWSDVPEAEAKKYHLTESLFPSDDVARFDLQHSMRFKPHLHDTGGFFVAVLEKTEEGFPDNLEKTYPIPTDGTSWEDMVKAGDKRIKQKALEYSLFRMTAEEAKVVTDALSLKEDFPSDHLFCRRTGGALRKAYLFSPLAKSIVDSANYKAGGGDFWPPLKVVAGGLRLAEKNSGNMGLFRPSQEATALLCKYTKADKLQEVPRSLLEALLSASSQPWMYQLAENEFEQGVANRLSDGTCILRLKDDAHPHRVVSCVVRKFGSKFHLWADATEVERLRVLIGMPIDDLRKSKKKPEAKAEGEAEAGAEGEATGDKPADADAAEGDEPATKKPRSED